MQSFSLYRGWRRLKSILSYSDITMTKLVIAAGSILWAVMLFWPGDTFGPTRQTYSLMAHWMSEYTWATLFMIHGFISTWAILWDRRDGWLVVGDCVLGCLLWTGSCSMMIWAYIPSSPPPAAISAEIVLAMLSWWFLVRNDYGPRP